MYRPKFTVLDKKTPLAMISPLPKTKSRIPVPSFDEKDLCPRYGREIEAVFRYYDIKNMCIYDKVFTTTTHHLVENKSQDLRMKEVTFPTETAKFELKLNELDERRAVLPKIPTAVIRSNQTNTHRSTS